ncbi:MAG: hypothetical protein GKR91_04925 [Pseudomonadales bacterium]|nr:hypothetical protein [Pseudomonadales bacterium]
MNWDTVGAIAELIGAVGVILSLLYLARQIRQGTQASRRVAVRELMGAGDNLLQQLGDDRERADLWVRGLETPEKLDDAERIQFSSLLLQNVRTWEQAYHWSKTDQLEGWVTEGNDALRNAILDSPGFSVWFERRKAWISSEFRQVLENELRIIDEKNSTAQ